MPDRGFDWKAREREDFCLSQGSRREDSSILGVCGPANGGLYLSISGGEGMLLRFRRGEIQTISEKQNPLSYFFVTEFSRVLNQNETPFFPFLVSFSFSC